MDGRAAGRWAALDVLVVDAVLPDAVGVAVAVAVVGAAVVVCCRLCRVCVCVCTPLTNPHLAAARAWQPVCSICLAYNGHMPRHMGGTRLAYARHMPNVCLTHV